MTSKNELMNKLREQDVLLTPPSDSKCPPAIGSAVMPQALEKQLTFAQVAELINCSQRTVRRLVDSGQLKAYRYGQRIVRVDPLDVAKLREPVTPLATHVELERELAAGGAQ